MRPAVDADRVKMMRTASAVPKPPGVIRIRMLSCDTAQQPYATKLESAPELPDDTTQSWHGDCELCR